MKTVYIVGVIGQPGVWYGSERIGAAIEFIRDNPKGADFYIDRLTLDNATNQSTCTVATREGGQWFGDDVRHLNR